MTDAAEAPLPEFRPSWAAFHRRVLARMLFAAPLGVLILIIALWPSIGLALIMLGAALTVGGLLAWLYFARARVRVEDAAVQLRALIGTRGWARRDIARLVFVPLPGPATGPAQPATLYAVSPLDERLFWLSGELWERTALNELAATLGAEVHEVPMGLSPQEVRQRFPGTVGWTAVRPWLFVLLVTGIAMASMLLVAMATTFVLIATGQVQLPNG